MALEQSLFSSVDQCCLTIFSYLKHPLVEESSKLTGLRESRKSRNFRKPHTVQSPSPQSNKARDSLGERELTLTPSSSGSPRDAAFAGAHPGWGGWAFQWPSCLWVNRAPVSNFNKLNGSTNRMCGIISLFCHWNPFGLNWIDIVHVSPRKATQYTHKIAGL